MDLRDKERERRMPPDLMGLFALPVWIKFDCKALLRSSDFIRVANSCAARFFFAAWSFFFFASSSIAPVEAWVGESLSFILRALLAPTSDDEPATCFGSLFFHEEVSIATILGVNLNMMLPLRTPQFHYMTVCGCVVRECEKK